MDKGFKPNTPVQVVVRPEDVKVVPMVQGQIAGVLESNNRRLKSGALRAALEKARREEESKC